MTFFKALFQSESARLFRRFWSSFLYPYRWSFIVSAFFMAITALSTAALAHFVKDVFDDIFLAKAQERLWFLGSLVLGVFALKGFSAFGHSFVLTRAGQKISALFQQALFKRLVYADHTLFACYPSGKLLSLLTYDTQVVFRGLTQTLVSFVRDSLTLICLVILMFYQDWRLSCVACFGFPLSLCLVLFVGKKMRYLSGQTQEAMGALHAFFQQAFQGISLIKAYTMEAFEIKRARENVDAFVRFNLKNARIKAFLHPLMESIGGTAVAIVIFYGGYQVIMGVRSPGALMSFITALLMSYEPLKKLAHLNGHLQEALSALARLFRLYDTPQTIHDTGNAKALQVSNGEVVFDNISFAYKKEAPLFQNFSCTIDGGKRIALVGHSGAGKSTLLHLMLRFYDVTAGRILVDGQDIRAVTLASLRQSMAFVSQDTILFDDTIANNIRYGCLDATDAAVEKAAKQAFAHDFIRALPDGYQAAIGERGLRLSGGQRQRLAIARAFLKNAPLLLLDEATSSLDSASEQWVQKALEKLMHQRTTFIIAHRLNTVQNADTIYVLDQGAIVEQGTHSALLKKRGVYAKLVAPSLEMSAVPNKREMGLKV